MKHLDERTQEIVLLSDEERIRHIYGQHWIAYTRSMEILAKLEDLLNHPPTHRMPNLLVVGDTNNGKTAILKRFESKHPSYIRPEIDGLTYPVLYIQAPFTPDVGQFYNLILQALNYPHRTGDHMNKKHFQVMNLLKNINLKILVIDEIQHILSGNVAKQRTFLNMLKFMGNELQIPIVCAGTRDAFSALQSDPQFANRFKPAVLDSWTLDEDFFILLATYERLLPLKKASDLTDDNLAATILSLSEGTIGEILDLLKIAAKFAITSGSEKITVSLLNKIDWISPSKRREHKIFF